MYFRTLSIISVVLITTYTFAVEAAVDKCFTAESSVECSDNFTDWSGEFSSPNYPSNYSINSRCVWSILAPGPDSTIKIEFKDDFITERTQDYLVVIDGLNKDSPPLIRMNGTVDNPEPIQSTTGHIWACFYSDFSDSRPGFQANFTVTGTTPEPTTPTTTTPEPTTIEPTPCGQDFVDITWGNFSSPEFPLNYPLNALCEWRFSAPEGNLVHITLGQELQIEHDRECEYDYLEFRNGPDSDSPVITKICGHHEEPLAITSTTNILYAKFYSDGQFNARGFMGIYQARKDEKLCLPSVETESDVDEYN